MVGINTWVAHRDPQVFGPDPNVFRPERWDPKTNDQEKLKQMEAYYSKITPPHAVTAPQV